jgi:uncharacterized membrane protein
MKPKDIKKKLEDLYWKTDEMRKELISLHGMLTQTGFFEEEKQVQNYRPPVVQPVKQLVIPPVAPPVQQPFTPPVAPPPQQITPPVVPPPTNLPPVQQPVIPPVVPPAPPQPKPAYTPPPAPQYQQPVQQQYQPSNYYQQPKPNTPAPEKESMNLEKFIGEKLMFIAIGILVIGISFFVKYAIDQNWINEAGRTGIGILAGGIILGFAHFMRKTYTKFSSVLVGGAIAVFYFTISYAFQVYHLFSQETAFALLVLITGFAVALSVAYNRVELAILAIVGGFASPIMVKTGQGNFTVLCTYMLILNVGMIALSWYKKWNIVNILSYAFTILLFAAAMNKEISDKPNPAYVSVLIFGTLFYITFFLMNVVGTIRRNEKFHAQEILLLLSNTLFYYACGYFVLHKMNADEYLGLFTLLVAVFNFIFAFALFRRQEVDRLMVYFLIGLVITFISLAGPVQLQGNHITLFWATEAVLLFWLWQKSDVRLIKTFSLLVTVVALLGLIYNWVAVYVQQPHKVVLDVMLNKGFVTGIAVVLALAVKSWLVKKEKEDIVDVWAPTQYRKALHLVSLSILFISGAVELYYQLRTGGSNQESIYVYMTTYVSVFTLAVWNLFAPLNLTSLRKYWTAFSVLLMIIYGALNFAVIELRDTSLINYNEVNRGFLLHYVNTITLFIMAAIIGYRLMQNKEAERELRVGFLWFISIFTVYAISAEMDHVLVLLRYNSASDILPIISQNQKIGYPVIWGICSFILIFVGMRRREYQMRVIALALFALVLIKLLFLGFTSGSQAGKIIAFIVLGVILLLVAFLYQKLKSFLFEEEENKNAGNHEQNG